MMLRVSDESCKTRLCCWSKGTISNGPPMSRTRSEANGGGFHYNYYITWQSLPPHQSSMQATLWSRYSVKEIEERYRYKWILWLWVQSVVRCGNPQIWTHPDSDVKCKPQNNPQINTHQESHHVTSQNINPDHN